MQLIWTPKLINICGEEEDTPEMFRRRPLSVTLPLPLPRQERRPFPRLSLACPFCYLPQVNNKAAKGLCIICTQRWKQTCCFACHFPTFHLPLSTCHLPHATESSWAEAELSFHIKFTFFGAMIYCQRALQAKEITKRKTEGKQVEKVRRKQNEKGKRIFRRPEMKFEAS